MSDQKAATAFVARVDAVHRATRFAEVSRGVGWTLLVVACGLILLAAADSSFELPWLNRAVGLAVVAATGGFVATRQIIGPLIWWSRPRTAVEIEQRFPELGQRVRTVVQFSGHDAAEVAAVGVAPALVTALENETDRQAQPLDLNLVIPRRGAVVAALLASIPIVLLIAALFRWDTRLAVQRSLLSNRSYTQLEVTPGDLTVVEGRDAKVTLKLTGRVGRRVMVYARPTEPVDAAWQTQELTAEDVTHSTANAIEFHTQFDQVQQPIEYHVVAGPARSVVYRIDVRGLLSIGQFQAVLTPPAYTGIEPSTVDQGDLDLIEGTRVNFQVTLDRPCTDAYMLLTDLRPGAQHQQADSPQQRVPMTVARKSLSAELEFRHDTDYSIVATSRDGLSLRPNRYRVHVRKDLPPRIHFETPDESLEVHSIAEVPLRIRVDDDLGLTKVGIVFQVDNGPEETLLAKDVFEKDVAKTAAERGGSKLPPVTHVALARLLALEDHDLTPNRSVTYYAFAEDTRPDGPQRVETDLRFIDIRPFLRFYKVGGT